MRVTTGESTTRPRATALDQTSLPEKSAWLYRGFARFTRWYVKRHFHALRLAKPGWPDDVADQPVLVYLNHPAWWDPLIGLMLADLGFGERMHYAPIDAAAIREYAFFQKLGFFGIDPQQRQGGARFLRLGQRVMRDTNRALWVTAQGTFTDPRDRPVALRPGVAHLAPRLERGIILPLGIEYPFWREKKPEALACFGEPIEIASASPTTVDDWQTLLTSRLEQTMDQLAELAKRRDEADWAVLLSSKVGTTGLYDLWRGIRAKAKGERFRRSHREVMDHD